MRNAFVHLLGFLVALVVVANSGHASMSVFGGTNFSSNNTPRSSYDSQGSTSASSSSHDWSGKIGLGMGVSQLISDQTPASASHVTDTSFQMNLAGILEKKLIGPFSAESGLVLGTQFVNMGTQGTVFTARYLDVPVLARLYLSKYFSLGGGAFTTIPLQDSSTLDPSKRLSAPDMGLEASARWNIPVTRLVDWYFEGNISRGLVHLSDAGTQPNHIRNFGAVAGMNAKF